jgi:hypothetical protein
MVLNTGRHDWPPDALASRQGLRLPDADGMRELGAAICLNDVEHHRGGGAGFDVVQMQSERRGSDLTCQSIPATRLIPPRGRLPVMGNIKVHLVFDLKMLMGFVP